MDSYFIVIESVDGLLLVGQQFDLGGKGLNAASCAADGVRGDTPKMYSKATIEGIMQ